MCTGQWLHRPHFANVPLFISATFKLFPALLPVEQSYNEHPCLFMLPTSSADSELSNCFAGRASVFKYTAKLSDRALRFTLRHLCVKVTISGSLADAVLPTRSFLTTWQIFKGTSFVVSEDSQVWGTCLSVSGNSQPRPLVLFAFVHLFELETGSRVAQAGLRVSIY